MAGPTLFSIEVRRTQTTTVHLWVDGNAVSPEDKAAAIGRAEHRNEWESTAVEVVGIEKEENHGGRSR